MAGTYLWHSSERWVKRKKNCRFDWLASTALVGLLIATRSFAQIGGISPSAARKFPTSLGVSAHSSVDQKVDNEFTATPVCNVAGYWDFVDYDQRSCQTHTNLFFTQAGNQITGGYNNPVFGTCGPGQDIVCSPPNGDPIAGGDIQGNRISWTENLLDDNNLSVCCDTGNTVTMTGTIAGDCQSMWGDWSNTCGLSGTWSASRCPGAASVAQGGECVIDPDPVPTIPTMSEWGLVVLGVLTLTAGTLVLRHRMPA